jgi:hypothetical protein
MKRGPSTALVFVLFSITHAEAQVVPPLPPGGYYINCPTAFNNVFHNYGYVEYQGHEWDSVWFASSPSPPLPSLRWYKPPSTTTTLISRDRRAQWSRPEVQVLCWIYNALDIIAYHYDPYAFRGTVTECGSAGGGGGGFITDPALETGYDPYDGYPPTDQCPSSSGGGSGGSASCHDEYVYVEISYDGGATWQVLWEGWAEVCI